MKYDKTPLSDPTAHGKGYKNAIANELFFVTGAKVREPPRWPRSWANFSLLYLYAHWNARANLHLLG
jgi:hypothetical protein